MGSIWAQYGAFVQNVHTFCGPVYQFCTMGTLKNQMALLKKNSASHTDSSAVYYLQKEPTIIDGQKIK